MADQIQTNDPRHDLRVAGLILALLAWATPAQAVCTPSGTISTNLALCSPASGETGWASGINGNWTVLDALFSAGPLLTPGKGGTGVNAAVAANGKTLIGNGAGFTLATLTGTANQVIVTNGAGTITLSAPQNLHAAATPSFAGLKDTNGLNWLTQTATASAVNNLNLSNTATGVSPTLSAIGTDTNLNLILVGKGTGGIVLGATGSTPVTQLVVYSQTITPASVAGATCAEQTFTVTGVTTADKIFFNPVATGNATSAGQIRVSAANTVAITYCNPTVGALTPGAGTANFLAVRS